MKSVITTIVLFVALAFALPQGLSTRGKHMPLLCSSHRLLGVAFWWIGPTNISIPDVSVEVPSMTDSGGNVVPFDSAGVQTGT